MARIGIDTGGTFTDFVWLDETGRFRIQKQLSTPADPSEAILQGIGLLDVPENVEVVHGSTVATNALLERKGARTALITTDGFADVLAIGRQNRPDLYALVPQKPAPLVPQKWRFEVPERVSASGEIIKSLDADSLEQIIHALAVDDIESVAVCLLFSFLVPEHERQIKDFIADWFQKNKLAGGVDQPNIPHISLSSEILPEYREYERTATTVVNAYVAPLMDRYLSHLDHGLGRRNLTVMQSNGGIINAKTAGDQAVRTVLSGPAGGVVGARHVAQLAGYSDVITFDMGGTSTDVALCPGYLPITSNGQIAGLPLRVPIIDIHTVGAGGGSLAYVDAGGALHVGPESAGADPGPACYGRGLECEEIKGAVPVGVTTTDANLLLGRLDANHFLGGEMRLHEQLAQAAFTRLAADMGNVSREEAAWGVIQVANANMERAIRQISVERGYDPRRFTLVAFGGAGPLHACELAQNLQIPRVLIPTFPGVLSALGMLAAAPAKDYSQTALRRFEHDEPLEWRWLDEQFLPLQTRAEHEMAGDGYDPTQLTLNKYVDLRYAGQSHELTVPYRPGRLTADFHTAHEIRFGYKREKSAVEVVTIRLTAITQVEKPPFNKEEFGSKNVEAVMMAEKPVWFAGREYQAHQYLREELHPGHFVPGPAVIYQYDTTTVVPPAWIATVDGYRNLIIQIAD